MERSTEKRLLTERLTGFYLPKVIPTGKQKPKGFLKQTGILKEILKH